jgi:hypothetical protein
MTGPDPVFLPTGNGIAVLVGRLWMSGDVVNRAARSPFF